MLKKYLNQILENLNIKIILAFIKKVFLIILQKTDKTQFMKIFKHKNIKSTYFIYYKLSN